MDQYSYENKTNITSVENSVSTNEFLNIEKSCEVFKDSDEEIKLIFNEISKLSGHSLNNNVGDDLQDNVELILKRAEVLAEETKNILKKSPGPTICNAAAPIVQTNDTGSINIPVIKVTKPRDSEENRETNKKPVEVNKINQQSRQNGKDNFNELRRKQKVRPFSASVIESKKKELSKVSRCFTNAQKKIVTVKQDSILEELKDTNERVKSLELLNVQLTEDNKALRKRLDQVNDEKHRCDLKLVECEQFLSRIAKEFENRNYEFKAAKENENKLIYDLTRERNERKNLTVQHDKDRVAIQDLQRQCREMEMILKRKHPDSVSALIVAAKSTSLEDNKKKLLEERIVRLEQELKNKEDHFQGVLFTLQDKFEDMKQKYENHIVDVERQLMDDRKLNADLKNRVNKSTRAIDVSVQTIAKGQRSLSTQTFIRSAERASSAVSRITQNSALILNKLREDSHLIATIKGLQSELTMKQRTIAKINRETEELRKNLRNLQKEKEVLMNLNPHKKGVGSRQAKSTENILMKVNSEMESELVEARKQREVLVQERNSLLESLKRSNEEFILLKKKRIQDLHTLQLAHEKELMQMNMQIYPLQEEIQLLNRTVEILQDRIRSSEDKALRYQVDIRDVHVTAGGDNHGIRGIHKKT